MKGLSSRQDNSSWHLCRTEENLHKNDSRGDCTKSMLANERQHKLHCRVGLPRWRQRHCRFNQRMLIFVVARGEGREPVARSSVPSRKLIYTANSAPFPLQTQTKRPSRPGAAPYFASSNNVRKEGWKSKSWATTWGTVRGIAASDVGSPDRHNSINWRTMGKWTGGQRRRRGNAPWPPCIGHNNSQAISEVLLVQLLLY